MKLSFGAFVFFYLGIGSPVALGTTSNMHIEIPIEQDVESPEILVTSVPTGKFE